MNNFSKPKPVKRRWLRWLKYIVLIVIALIIFGIFFPQYLPQKPEKEISPLGPKVANCQREFNPKYTSEPYYKGDIFDAHFHMPVAPGIKTPFIKQARLGEGKDVTLNELLCMFEKEKSRGAIAFYMPKKTNRASIPQAKEISERAKDQIALYLAPTTLNSDELEKILDENPGLFVGIGEMQFYEITNLVRPLDGKWAAKIFEIAAKRNLPVMFHPGRNQLDKVDKVLAENPNVTFFLHGYELEPHIDQLMAKYPNIYYTIDGATLYAMKGNFVRGNKNKFVVEMKKEFGTMLEERSGYWHDKISQYPDRFMLGTDRGSAWHYDEEMSTLTEEFSRAFIGRLDPGVQEKFAYKNAEKLLNK